MRREPNTRVALMVEIGLYRNALARALPRFGLDVVACAASKAEAITMAGRDEVDVVLVDVSEASGLETLRALAEAKPGARVVALAVRDRDPDVLTCIERGAVGYVLRDASLAELADATRRALRDEPLASPHFIATLMRRVAALSANGDRTSFGNLTSRELEVAQLIEKGLSNKEIAAQLSIAVTTVKNHVHSILDKLKVHRRGEAASLLRGSGPSSP